MKIVYSINSDIKKTLNGDESVPKYGGTRDLYKISKERGHKVSFICPNEVIDEKKGIFSKEYEIDNGKIKTLKENCFLEGDVFFMRGFAQDVKSLHETKKFFKTLKNIEKNFDFMINSPQAAWFDLKNYQKKLDLPFIPSPNISSFETLEKELKNNKKIVAKPNSGFHGKGMYYLENVSQMNKLKKNIFDSHSFEYFITGDEPRYIFLDNEIIVKRNLVKPKVFGEQSTTKLEMPNIFENKDEIGIVKKAIQKTGMFYGCIDFKGKYILEINGSGTNQFAIKPNGKRYYDLGNKIIKTIEDKLRK